MIIFKREPWLWWVPIRQVKPEEQEKVIVKHYPNSFRETGLYDYLITNGITDLVICGMFRTVFWRR